MDTVTTDTTTPDKAITVDVPADRVPEFYAWYARFLAGETGRGRRRGRHGGHRGGPYGRCHEGPHHHGRCHHEHHAGEDEPAASTTTRTEPAQADA